MHKNPEEAQKKSVNLKQMLSNETSLEGLEVIRKEVASTYHSVQHGQSYNSLDCYHKLLPVMFPDSPTAQKLRCGRTKATAIVQTVLGPFTETFLVKRLRDVPYFSVCSDATNKGKFN